MTRYRLVGDEWIPLNPSTAPSSTRFMVPEYECVDYALPRRKMEKYHKGKLYKAGINRQTGKDTHDITKLYPRVDKSSRAVFKNRRELTEFFSHESVKAAGYFYDR